MDVVLSWERLLWSQRALFDPRERYVLTDFRIAFVSPNRVEEIALQDIVDIEQRQSTFDRLARRSTLIVHGRGSRRLTLAHVRRGASLAALLEVASAETAGTLKPDAARALLAWEPRSWFGYRESMIGFLGLLAAAFLVVISLHGKASAVTYAVDDAIAPGGVKKDSAAIARFMETEVVPWARITLGPIVGGADRVSCQTCHGADAENRHWAMPSVAALPQPAVAAGGWEHFGGNMDAQLRNAIYGYIAGSDNQAKAAYMREVVMPGMAGLLHRPPYDFTRSYDYNRSHVAFGCYHCHRVS